MPQMVTRFLTTEPMDLSSENLSVRPPSNRISPTEMETRGMSSSPSNSSGLSQPNSGPAVKPASNSNRMDGR